MILISHRGNLSGPDPSKENHPDYIRAARSAVSGVEVDVWFLDGKFVLGHDHAQYEINKEFLYGTNMWCHAKNPRCYLWVSTVFGIKMMIVR